MARFNTELTTVEGYEVIATVALRARFQPGPFWRSLTKRPPIDDADLLARAQKYIILEHMDTVRNSSTSKKKWRNSSKRKKEEKKVKKKKEKKNIFS